MKVAMLGWEFPPFMAGGLGIHCLELTFGLSRQGVAIDFYMPRVETREGPVDIASKYTHLNIREVDADASVEPYGRARMAYDGDFNRAVMHYNARLVQAFASHDADVIHCHDWITVPAALEIQRMTGKPLVFTVHSTESDRSAGFYPQHWIEEIERDGVRLADLVIAVSDYTKDLLVRQYGGDPSRIVSIHNGIDSSKFRRRRDYSQASTVLFLARLSRQKGPMFFLRTARRVLEERPETHFVIAGRGELMPECIDYTIEHGISDRVRFAGFVPDEELADFYASHDVYVLPSVSEPFGISVLEAMATGLPTIVTRTSGVSEGISHALKSAYWDVEEMADMILALLQSPELREEMGHLAAREAERFTWAQSAGRTAEAYGAALRNRHTAHTTKTPIPA